jgi:hypothetical protein
MILKYLSSKENLGDQSHKPVFSTDQFLFINLNIDYENLSLTNLSTRKSKDQPSKKTLKSR